MEKILIVDSYHFTREYIAEELVQAGYMVAITGNPAAIGEMISQFAPDLLLFDLRLHGEERWDILTEIKKNNSHIGVIILAETNSYARDPRIAIADGYIVKSVLAWDLKQKIAEVLRKKEKSKAGNEGLASSELSGKGG